MVLCIQMEKKGKARGGENRSEQPSFLGLGGISLGVISKRGENMCIIYRLERRRRKVCSWKTKSGHVKRGLGGRREGG